MTLNADNVRSALTGAVYVAPSGTTYPADPTSAWDAGFLDLGYLSEDGITEAHSADWNQIRAWQNRTVVRQLLTGSEATFAFTLLETTATGLEVYHGGSVVVDQGGDVYRMEVVEPEEDYRVWGLDVVDGDDHIRIIIPDGTVTETGDIVYQNGEAVGYPITVSARSDTNGLVAIKMSDSTAWAST